VEVERVVVAVAIAAVAAAIALVARRRRTDAPTGGTGRVPVQLDRSDFERPDAPWLVAVFTSSTCDACRDVWTKAEVLASAEVAVEAVEFPGRRDLHQRYRIDAVPLVLVADVHGVVHSHALGPVSASELWSAVAEARSAAPPRPG
jgi:hypothetical protein